MTVPPICIWRFRDGKPGHEQQTLGLVQALRELTPVDVIEFDVREYSAGVADWLLARFPAGVAKRRPDLLIGAGHATHLPMLAARRVAGGRIVLLMKPTLPASVFDLVVAPEHDGMTPSENVIVTRGVLNPMRPGEKTRNSTLILLGGESKHAGWSNEAILEQLAVITGRLQKSATLWRLTDSRRTPEALGQELQKHYGERFQPWATCPPGWLAQRLAGTDNVWVSEDSASMIYEALSAGCRVGVLPLPDASRRSRVIAGVRRLQEDGMVMSFSDWAASPSSELPRNSAPLAEAARVAALVLARLRSGVPA